jgi:hypothetical protein
MWEQAKTKKSIILILMLLAAAVLAAPKDAAAISMIQMGQNGKVQFASGGVGEGERADMKKMTDDYNLKLVFASGGRYLSGVDVEIRKPGGERMLAAKSSGPWMLIDLPAGSYEVVSTVRAESMTRRVQVGQDFQSVVFEWKPEEGIR